MLGRLYFSIQILLLFFIVNGCTAVTSVDQGVGPSYYLPRGVIDIEIKEKKLTPKKYAIIVHGAIYLPDTGFDYVTRYIANPFSDDSTVIGLEVDDNTKRPNGFLSKIEFTGDDKTDEFIIKLVELAKTVTKINAFTPEGEGFVDDAANFTTVYRGTFDPLSSSDRKRMNILFDRITGNAFNVTIPPEIRGRYQDNIAPRSACSKGICFRKPLNVPLIFKLKDGKEFKRVNVVLPDRSSIGTVHVSRAAFVKKVTKVELTSGMIKSVSIEKPSEALAAIEIPLAIANAILAVPGEILKLKIDTSTQNKDLLEARLSELKAREALVEFQREQAEKERKRAEESNNNDAPEGDANPQGEGNGNNDAPQN